MPGLSNQAHAGMLWVCSEQMGSPELQQQLLLRLRLLSSSTAALHGTCTAASRTPSMATSQASHMPGTHKPHHAWFGAATQSMHTQIESRTAQQQAAAMMMMMMITFNG
jgi:hypothetical protein